MSTSMPNEIETTRVVSHDPNLADVILHVDYDLPAAVSELIDNSIDANAKNVLVRLLRNRTGLVGMQVIDDGIGIKQDEFDDVMRFAKRRKYGPSERGLYGIGLKSGSLSMADQLSVVSMPSGSVPSGRRWTRETAKLEQLAVLSSAYCLAVMQHANMSIPWKNWVGGTIVDLSELDDFKRVSGDASQVSVYADELLTKIEQHTGLVFHRLLDAGRKSVKIHLDILDTDSCEPFGSRCVEAVDPFGYTKSGCTGYPKKFRIRMAGRAKPMTVLAHIWPKGVKSNNFRIPRSGHASAAEGQGLYIYRNDRLLMSGGWGGMRNPEDHQSLARMAINLCDSDLEFLEPTFNKTGVKMVPTFCKALRDSSATDGTTFIDWIEKAIAVARKQSQSAPQVKLPLPQSGVAVRVRNAFSEVSSNGDEVEVIWKRMPKEIVFSVEAKNSIVYINKAYENALSNDCGSTTLTRTTLSTTLILLLAKDLLVDRKGKNVKALEDAIQTILVAAIKGDDF